ncbi:MAG: hypothetical protein IT223_07325 [Crocinitomicaceae bacterium]|nr:hypothetical protein [Crocinitomicaceae bacterium]
MATHDIVSTSGVILILIAFVLLQLRKLSIESVAFNFANFAGGALASIGAFIIDAWPFFILEGVWALAALYGLFSNKCNIKK